ncbi:hypothetical protein DENSPDRAFT_540829 [Dentipellis sp. KUC8613]|nr:hypothetical protein DENSPDRAFT_540829 [Dentipellis sp. KUC8613]
MLSALHVLYFADTSHNDPRAATFFAFPVSQDTLFDDRHRIAEEAHRGIIKRTIGPPHTPRRATPCLRYSCQAVHQISATGYHLEIHRMGLFLFELLQNGYSSIGSNDWHTERLTAVAYEKQPTVQITYCRTSSASSFSSSNRHIPSRSTSHSQSQYYSSSTSSVSWSQQSSRGLDSSLSSLLLPPLFLQDAPSPDEDSRQICFRLLVFLR